ncbi:MAG: glycine zipper family protein [Azospirillum sp.]|nr:glycine zipper family protein [Azospirillum sp.]
MARLRPWYPALAAVALGACAALPPTGPSVMALPAKGKSFADFQQDDALCQQYAAQQIGYGSPAQAATDSAVSSALVGTAIGAAAGAALGAAAGNPAVGAAIGAGTGLLIGSAAGTANAQASAAGLQQRYDMRYLQCMSGRGESVPSQVAAPPSTAYPAPGYPYPAYPAYPYSAYPYPYYAPAYAYPAPVTGSVYFGGSFHSGGHPYHHW